MVSATHRHLKERLMDLQGDPSIPITPQNLLRPCMEASDSELHETRIAFVHYISGIWDQALKNRKADQLKVLAAMAVRAASILDACSFCCGAKSGGKQIAQMHFMVGQPEEGVPHKPGSTVVSTPMN